MKEYIHAAPSRVQRCPNVQVTWYPFPSMYPSFCFFAPNTSAISRATEGFSAIQTIIIFVLSNRIAKVTKTAESNSLFSLIYENLETAFSRYLYLICYLIHVPSAFILRFSTSSSVLLFSKSMIYHSSDTGVCTYSASSMVNPGYRALTACFTAWGSSEARTSQLVPHPCLLTVEINVFFFYFHPKYSLPCNLFFFDIKNTGIGVHLFDEGREIVQIRLGNEIFIVVRIIINFSSGQNTFGRII